MMRACRILLLWRFSCLIEYNAFTALCSSLTLLTTEFSSQAHVASFLTKTNNKFFK